MDQEFTPPPPKPNKITNDLLARLHSQLPLGTLVPGQEAYDIRRLPEIKNASATSYATALAELEERLDFVNRKLDTMSANKGPDLPAETPKVEEAGDRDAVTAQLQEIVAAFNISLESWYKNSGCVANFAWGYQQGKKLEVTSIDYIVYRKAAPDGQTIKEVLSRGVP
jgi:hypothetical protein